MAYRPPNNIQRNRDLAKRAADQAHHSQQLGIDATRRFNDYAAQALREAQERARQAAYVQRIKEEDEFAALMRRLNSRKPLFPY